MNTDNNTGAGRPCYTDNIPLIDLKAHTAALKDELLERFASVLDRTAFCLGPEVQAFEQEFAAYCGAAHGVGTNSGTSALHLALLALGIEAGDEVITTPYTFAATAWAISYCGATPVFADIDPDTFNLDPRAVAQAITPRTKAILAVHLYGQPADMAPLLDLARQKGLPLVEDAAQAHGAKYGVCATGGLSTSAACGARQFPLVDEPPVAHLTGRVGSLGTISAFSFYPTKNLSACGEAGMALTQDAALAAKMRALRDHGSTKRYYHDTIGYNYRMEGMQAAVLRVKLPQLDTRNSRRNAIARMYDARLKGTSLIAPKRAPNSSHVYHLYVVRHPRRDALAAHLQRHGIGTGTHYPLPLYRQPAYAHLKLPEGLCPRAEQACRECLSLPMYPELTDAQVERVAKSVLEWEQTA